MQAVKDFRSDDSLQNMAKADITSNICSGPARRSTCTRCWLRTLCPQSNICFLHCCGLIAMDLCPTKILGTPYYSALNGDK